DGPLLNLIQGAVEVAKTKTSVDIGNFQLTPAPADAPGTGLALPGIGIKITLNPFPKKGGFILATLFARIVSEARHFFSIDWRAFLKIRLANFKKQGSLLKSSPPRGPTKVITDPHGVLSFLLRPFSRDASQKETPESYRYKLM